MARLVIDTEVMGLKTKQFFSKRGQDGKSLASGIKDLVKSSAKAIKDNPKDAVQTTLLGVGVIWIGGSVDDIEDAAELSAAVEVSEYLDGHR